MGTLEFATEAVIGFSISNLFLGFFEMCNPRVMLNFM